jgi:hypothetical protein
MSFLVFDILAVIALLAGMLIYPKLKARSAAKKAPPRKRWALALADIQLRRNGLPHQTDSLQINLPAAELKRLREAVLQELEINAQQSDAALAAAVERSLNQWAQGMGTDRGGFFYHVASVSEVRMVMALESARTAFLVRCLALLGLCREDQAWLILFLNAQRAQDIFQSWADFGHAYAQARYAWIEQKNQEAASQRSFVEVQEYLNERLGNWSTLAWDDYKIFDPQPVKP